jgi:large subunit ribosomal protein L29
MSKKAATFREMGDRELLEKLAESKKELFNLRFQNATGQLERTAGISEVRKDVARLNTLLREREIAAADALLETEKADG